MATIVGADRDVVTIYPQIVGQIHAFTLRPSDAAQGPEVTCPIIGDPVD
jgi:hypothetical protein